MNLKEELYRIQDLMNVSRKILTEAKAPTPSVEGSCLRLTDYSKGFTAAEAGTEQRAQEFINGILEFVKTNTPNLYNNWVKGATLEISDSTLIGCASNRVTSDRNRKYVQYAKGGGRPVLPTMDNNYVVKSYNKASYNDFLKKSGIPDFNYPEYDIYFNDDLKYAEDRVNNLWAAMKPLLTKNRIIFKTEPKIDKHIVDTGGRLDENRDKSKYSNPGQVVLFYGKICEYEEEFKGTTDDLNSCLGNLFIGYDYDAVVKSTNPHHCDWGRFQITANGIVLKRMDGLAFASVNNKDNSEIDKKSSSLPQPTDKGNDNFRYNRFKIDGELAKKIISADPSGNITIVSTGLRGPLGNTWTNKKDISGSPVHMDAARVTITDSFGNVFFDTCSSGKCTGKSIGTWVVKPQQYCKTTKPAT